MTVRSPARSRPTGLSRGHRSVSESDQRRALMLPQELMKLPSDDLIVLKAGLPPVGPQDRLPPRPRLLRTTAAAADCPRPRGRFDSHSPPDPRTELQSP